jgi:4-hydroxybenzoate polyprenyltransferase
VEWKLIRHVYFSGYVNMIGTAIFLVYPFLKFYTHWAQLGGAVLIAAISPMAWAACAAWSSSYTGSGIGAAFKSMRANWQLCLTSFVIEMIFSFLHETVYGCQVHLSQCVISTSCHSRE